MKVWENLMYKLWKHSLVWLLCSSRALLLRNFHFPLPLFMKCSRNYVCIVEVWWAWSDQLLVRSSSSNLDNAYGPCNKHTFIIELWCMRLTSMTAHNSLNTMHQSIPAVQSHSRELRGICAFRGWGIRNVIMSRGWGICVPRGDPWAFDTHGFRNWHGGIYQPGWGVCGRLASLLRSRQIVFLNFRYSSSLVNLIKNNNLSNLWHSSTYNVASDEHILLGTMEQLGVKLWI